jgi:hypothetical protein
VALLDGGGEPVDGGVDFGSGEALGLREHGGAFCQR